LKFLKQKKSVYDLSYISLEKINEVLSWMFFVEMVIKMIGLGLKGYSRDNFNLFDCFIVVVSALEIVLGWIHLGDGKKIL
jgi:hypothetical protein